MIINTVSFCCYIADFCIFMRLLYQYPLSSGFMYMYTVSRNHISPHVIILINYTAYGSLQTLWSAAVWVQSVNYLVKIVFIR